MMTRCRRNLARMPLLALPLVVSSHHAQVRRVSPPATLAPPKVLLVVAHPDDEYYFAATVYRIAKEIQGVVDQVVITNGEAGYRYSALAERVYGKPLTEESAGRARLPEIRKRETLRAGRVLGIRKHYFLGQKDHRYTLDPDEALRVWNQEHVRDFLRRKLKRERYDFVFVLLPVEDTHGHHAAASLLALEAAASMEPDERPAVLGAEPARREERPRRFDERQGYGLSRTVGSSPVLEFDRRRSFGFHDALRYDMVVNWVIAEHKSQGMFQNDWGRHDLERFWLFQEGPPDARMRVDGLGKQLSSR